MVHNTLPKGVFFSLFRFSFLSIPSWLGPDVINNENPSQLALIGKISNILCIH